MRYFIDTEFHEEPGTIALISVGIVAEDGREFYAEASDFDTSQCNDWVKENVLPHLWHKRSNVILGNRFSRDGGEGGLLATSTIGPAVRRFVGDDKPEFWGYYADYDWVVFCWLFGCMIDLPEGWPMYCRDIKQFADFLNISKDNLPPQTSTEHHALLDARWNKEAFDYLNEFMRPTSLSEQGGKE